MRRPEEGLSARKKIVLRDGDDLLLADLPPRYAGPALPASLIC
jgi:hypothetical protein